MLDIIQNNPYRLLGIYSNSPTKERVANHNRLKAFLKVGKNDVAFPLDLMLLPPLNRTTENVAEADAKLTLSNEQLRYAQFWFVKATAMDDIAMNHLIAKNLEKALSIWQKKDSASSLQNRIVCALIQNNLSKVFTCADILYSRFSNDFVNAVLGKNHTVVADKLEYAFLDELCSAIGTQQIMPFISNDEWKQYVGSKATRPLIGSLQSAIDTAKASKGKGSDARYKAGVTLMNETRLTLKQLGELLPPTDLQYQIIADKLAQEILQCGIDYFNDSDALDAAHKAMNLQSYALSIAVGRMAKDRCKENVDILQDIINNLPPSEVFAEDRVIKEELRKFCQLPDKICHAVTLLNNTKPHLQAIKARLGANNSYYLKISTLVVGNALHNIIEEVNAAQKDEMINIGGQQIPISMLLDRDTKIRQIKNTLQAAWNATKIMDSFDMESDFKNRYNQNRSILKGLCDQMGISTITRTPPSPTPPSNPGSTSGSSNNTSSNNSGCLSSIVIGIAVVTTCGVIGSVGGGLGSIIGIVVGLRLTDFIFDL